ncbi:MAG: hypothetical protein RR531_05455 [Longicatena sp.]
MRKILIATHGRTASGIRSTVELFMGELPIECIDAYLGGAEENYVIDIKKFVESITVDDEAYIFTDLLGGSVHQQVIAEVMKFSQKKIVVITNVNVAIVIELLTNQKFKSVEEVNQMVTEINMMPVAVDPLKLFEHHHDFINDDDFLD